MNIRHFCFCLGGPRTKNGEGRFNSGDSAGTFNSASYEPPVGGVAATNATSAAAASVAAKPDPASKQQSKKAPLTDVVQNLQSELAVKQNELRLLQEKQQGIQGKNQSMEGNQQSRRQWTDPAAEDKELLRPSSEDSHKKGTLEGSWMPTTFEKNKLYAGSAASTGGNGGVQHTPTTVEVDEVTEIMTFSNGQLSSLATSHAAKKPQVVVPPSSRLAMDAKGASMQRSASIASSTALSGCLSDLSDPDEFETYGAKSTEEENKRPSWAGEPPQATSSETVSSYGGDADGYHVTATEPPASAFVSGAPAAMVGDDRSSLRGKVLMKTFARAAAAKSAAYPQQAERPGPVATKLEDAPRLSIDALSSLSSISQGSRPASSSHSSRSSSRSFSSISDGENRNGNGESETEDSTPSAAHAAATTGAEEWGCGTDPAQGSTTSVKVSSADPAPPTLASRSQVPGSTAAAFKHSGSSNSRRQACEDISPAAATVVGAAAGATAGSAHTHSSSMANGRADDGGRGGRPSYMAGTTASAARRGSHESGGRGSHDGGTSHDGGGLPSRDSSASSTGSARAAAAAAAAAAAGGWTQPSLRNPSIISATSASAATPLGAKVALTASSLMVPPRHGSVSSAKGAPDVPSYMRGRAASGSTARPQAAAAMAAAPVSREYSSQGIAVAVVIPAEDVSSQRNPVAGAAVAAEASANATTASTEAPPSQRHTSAAAVAAEAPASQKKATAASTEAPSSQRKTSLAAVAAEAPASQKNTTTAVATTTSVAAPAPAMGVGAGAGVTASAAAVAAGAALPFGVWRFVRLKKPIACDACTGTAKVETLDGGLEVFQCDVALQPGILASVISHGEKLGSAAPGARTWIFCPDPLCMGSKPVGSELPQWPKKIQLEGSAKITRSELNALQKVGLDITAAKKVPPASAAPAQST